MTTRKLGRTVRRAISLGWCWPLKMAALGTRRPRLEKLEMCRTFSSSFKNRSKSFGSTCPPILIHPIHDLADVSQASASPFQLYVMETHLDWRHRENGSHPSTGFTSWNGRVSMWFHSFGDPKHTTISHGFARLVRSDSRSREYYPLISTILRI